MASIIPCIISLLLLIFVCLEGYIWYNVSVKKLWLNYHDLVRGWAYIESNLKSRPLTKRNTMLVDCLSTCPVNYTEHKLFTWKGNSRGCRCEDGNYYTDCRDRSEECTPIPQNEEIELSCWKGRKLCVTNSTDESPNEEDLVDVNFWKNKKESSVEDQGHSRAPIIGFSVAISNKPCVISSRSDLRKNSTSISLLKQKSEGCGEFGEDADLSEVIDEDTERRFYEGDSRLKKVGESIPFFLDTIEKEKVYLVARRQIMKTNICNITLFPEGQLDGIAEKFLVIEKNGLALSSMLTIVYGVFFLSSLANLKWTTSAVTLITFLPLLAELLLGILVARFTKNFWEFIQSHILKSGYIPSCFGGTVWDDVMDKVMRNMPKSNCHYFLPFLICRIVLPLIPVIMAFCHMPKKPDPQQNKVQPIKKLEEIKQFSATRGDAQDKLFKIYSSRLLTKKFQ